MLRSVLSEEFVAQSEEVEVEVEYQLSKESGIVGVASYEPLIGFIEEQRISFQN